jgi:hypothetical protein
MSQDNKQANLSIWTQVEKTDPAAQKPMFAADGANLTSINHNYQIKRATELFGPCGFGWGYDVINASIIDGAMVSNTQTKVSSVQIEFWYKHQDQVCKFSHFGQTPFVSVGTDEKAITDEDAHKKSLTDAIGKALSMLGFSADIYGQGSGDNVGKEPVAEDEITKNIKACKDLTALSALWKTLTKEQMVQYAKVKDETKVALGAA